MGLLKQRVEMCVDLDLVHFKHVEMWRKLAVHAPPVGESFRRSLLALCPCQITEIDANVEQMHAEQIEAEETEATDEARKDRPNCRVWQQRLPSVDSDILISTPPRKSFRKNLPSCVLWRWHAWILEA